MANFLASIFGTEQDKVNCSLYVTRIALGLEFERLLTVGTATTRLAHAGTATDAVASMSSRPTARRS